MVDALRNGAGIEMPEKKVTKLEKKLKLDLTPAQIRFTEPLERLLANEGDRGFILVAAAYLDDLLAQLLARHLVDDMETRARLLGIGAPLAEFAGRINVAYMMGKLSDEDRRFLQALARIRNDVAHDLDVEVFGEAMTGKIRSMPLAKTSVRSMVGR